MKLAYTLDIKSVESPAVKLYNSSVNGAAANNILGVNVFLRDSKNQDKYMIGGNFKADNKTYRFSLDPQKLLLNYDKWQVAQDNLIQYGEAGYTSEISTLATTGNHYLLTALPRQLILL
ncbi:hypothetical protein LWM68_04985 [Niabella sp. W65]|nr:hypothetical protein [Niabella sp. W65]MCH7362180.1 hypothetical protein [Niabella sp. W65]ULT45921.1 hypothetical protein KRR40_23580 [Niabella sp. I65]